MTTAATAGLKACARNGCRHCARAHRAQAKGSIRITNAASGEVLEATDLGVLQTTKDWPA
jgi:hypothetical protein